MLYDLKEKVHRKTRLQIRDYRRVFFFVGASICLLLAAVEASAQISSVTKPSAFAVSPRVIDIQDFDGNNPPNPHFHHPLPDRGNGNNQNGDDPARQNDAEPPVKGFPRAFFGGIGANGYAPPDTNIAVGPNHIVETVNAQYAIYGKNGGLLVGPKSLDSLWTALHGPCATNGGGDPIVQYDRIADRWLITQLGSATSSPYSECIAVSQTSDPAGAYYLYSYPYNSTLNDYQKFGVWPTATNSAYLATANLFANGASFTGGQLCAYDRSGMLSGSAAPASICYTISNDGGYQPADLDGPTPPLDGTPGYFMNFETLSSLRIYTLAPNFANPSASVLRVASPDLTVIPFTEACNGGTCIPQVGTNQQLDSLGDRLMYRLAFRIFADHEAMVVNHSVATLSTVGVRWYELRAPVSSTGTFSVFQEGTFSPADGTYRWMGSAAMDQAGDIAVGYSASSSSIHPAIRYTGRAPGDPPGTMGTEVSLLEGSGSQTSGLSRWGDYTALRIDPSDDCTLWYGNEYLPTNGTYNWSTFIASFKFTGCPGGPDFALSASLSSLTVLQGQSTTYTVTITPSNGFSGAVTLSASGLPSGATATFNPQSVPGSGSSSMTVTTSLSTPAGSYTLTITGSSGSLTHTTTVTLVVNAPPPSFDFSLSNGGNQTVVQGQSASNTITATLVSGTSQSVSFSASGLPAGATPSFSPGSCNPTCSSTLTVTTSASTPTGSTTVTVTGTAGSLSHTTTFTLTVNAPPPPGIVLVQHASKDAGTTTSSSLAFNTNNAAGNWIGVAIRAGRAGEVFTVMDSRGNTYHQAVQFNVTVDVPNGETLGIFYAENVTGGANTVTVSDTVSSTMRIAIGEYSGVAKANSLDVVVVQQGSGVSPNSGNATTTTNGDLLFGAIVTANPASFTAGGGYKIEETVPAEPNTKLIVEDSIQAAAGTASASASLGASDAWAAGVVAFRP